MKHARRLGVIGLQGGVGVSLVSALLSRALAREGKTTALLDAAPFASLQPSFLALRDASRPLGALRSVPGTLSPKALATFFAASPEGALHLPAAQLADGRPFPVPEWLPLIHRLSPVLDFLILDLGTLSMDPDRAGVLSACHRVLGVAPSDPLGLTFIAAAHPRLCSLADGEAHLSWIVNQVHSRQVPPKDAPYMPPGAAPPILWPHGGDDLTLSLREGRAASSSLDKAARSLAENLLAPERRWRSLPEEDASAAVSPALIQEAPGAFDPERLRKVQVLHQKLLEAFREQGLLQGAEEMGGSRRAALEPRARAVLEGLLGRESGLGPGERDQLLQETLQLAFGLGPLEPYLNETSVTEIMVNGPHHVFVERGGRLEEAPVRFLDEQMLRTSIERILSPIGRRLDESQPYVDGRLADGSRVNAVLPPISLDGPILTIRKFSKRQLTADDLVRLGSLTPEAAEFLGSCVQGRKNIVVSGGTGSGKTTLLNVLSGFIPESERIVTIEDSAELRLSQVHVVRLEARPANLEGKGRVAIRDLVINALRMRPDRIVVGEVRGGEALDMLQAMNTGHDGSLTTCHANTPRDALSRLETMCLMAGLDLPLRAVREQVVRAVHLIVQQSRLADGKRAVTHISEIQGMEGDVPVLQDLFRWNDDQHRLERLPFRASFES